MARIKSKNSKLSFNGWGLSLDEDVRVKELLTQKDITANQLIRTLVRRWMEENKSR